MSHEPVRNGLSGRRQNQHQLQYSHMSPGILEIPERSTLDFTSLLDGIPLHSTLQRQQNDEIPISRSSWSQYQGADLAASAHWENGANGLSTNTAFASTSNNCPAWLDLELSLQAQSHVNRPPVHVPLSGVESLLFTESSLDPVNPIPIAMINGHQPVLVPPVDAIVPGGGELANGVLSSYAPWRPLSLTDAFPQSDWDSHFAFLTGTSASDAHIDKPVIHTGLEENILGRAPDPYHTGIVNNALEPYVYGAPRLPNHNLDLPSFEPLTSVSLHAGGMLPPYLPNSTPSLIEPCRHPNDHNVAHTSNPGHAGPPWDITGAASTTQNSMSQAPNNQSLSGVTRARNLTLRPRRPNQPLPSRFACIQCSISHKRCERRSQESNVCDRCRNQKWSMSPLPCLYFDLLGVTLFRTATGQIVYKPYKKLSIKQEKCGSARPPDSLSGHTTVFELTQDLGTKISLIARPFDSSVIQGVLPESDKSFYSHPYELADLRDSKERIMRFVLRSVDHYVEARLEESDELSRAVFKEARNYVRKKGEYYNFVSRTLCLWTAARTIEDGWHFCGPESLGLRPDQFGTTPLVNAPLIDYQFAAIMVEEILEPLRDEVLKDLYYMTHVKAHTHWFALFLATFILLHSYGLLMQQQRSFARKKNAPKRYTRMPLVRSVHHGAKTLLAYYHHRCRKQRPFEADWASERSHGLQRMAKLTEREVKVMHSITQLVKNRAGEFARLAESDGYEEKHWFTGQLFIPTWTPPNTIEVSPPA